MGALAKFELEASWIGCANCGVSFAITAIFQRRLIDSHQTFYCPNGHSNIYNGKTAVERDRDAVQKKLDEERSTNEWLRGQLDVSRRAADAAKKTASAAKASVTRLKKRCSAGVCPFCNRTFKQLQMHMKSKHREEIHADGKASA
jgi:hypothetical protein